MIRRLLPPLLLAGAVLCGPARAAEPGTAQPDTVAEAAADTTGSISRPAEAPRPPVLARDARIAGDDGRTRLVLDLDRAVEIRTFTLADPYRVVVDLDDVVFAMAPAPAQLQRGIVTASRYGPLAPGKARMVLDVGGPVAIEKAFILDAVDDQPARLVVDLVPTDAATFARTLASAARPPAAAAPTPVAAAPAGDTRPVIVIDPGHGGIDSGTTGYSAYAEKNIVLEIGRALRDKLEKSGAYRVVMTRDTDTFIPLGERVRIARAHQASLFISLHADALARNDGKARGASVYTLSDTASDADAARLAEQENKADLIAGVNLSDESDAVAGILVDLAQRETRSFSAHFARELVHGLKGVARTHRGALKSAGFRVLRAHDVPSVLVELGYMSSKEDLKLLTSDAWRDQVSDAMAAAIGDFFAATRAAGQTARAEPGKARD
ncbi:N-acetylmuramoyl-L-alanine amidase [Xanthobacter sp. V2C-8]|uniref:N-acetylmuramoyl-L-alanine amidase n=1 Tax=Xanthobacter albus TaxID=3119929 RepID=UPI0037296BF2